MNCLSFSLYEHEQHEADQTQKQEECYFRRNVCQERQHDRNEHEDVLVHASKCCDFSKVKTVNRPEENQQQAVCCESPDRICNAACDFLNQFLEPTHVQIPSEKCDFRVFTRAF